MQTETIIDRTETIEGSVELQGQSWYDLTIQGIAGFLLFLIRLAAGVGLLRWMGVDI